MDPEYLSRLRPNIGPSRKQTTTIYTDRFLPTPESLEKADLSPRRKGSQSAPELSLYDQLLQTELLGVDNVSKSVQKRNMLSFRGAPPRLSTSPYSLSPISTASEKLLSAPRKPPRKIAKIPFKILEAPQIKDDFYLNLVDWSSTNILAVGLVHFVYLWNAVTSQATKLCDVGDNDVVTAVSWMQRGNHLAVATGRGLVYIWDVVQKVQVRVLRGHRARVGSLSWNGNLLCSGSRDRVIYTRDIRESKDYCSKFLGHRQEVCGLRWSHDKLHLASGGNDNKLLIWELRSPNPVLRFNEHTAAVKALTWSPHQRGLLASGGGTADRHIRLWNTISGQNLEAIDTGSQVCNLAWSKNVNEIVSTHGYSQNQVVVWSCPSMTQLATLTGHTMRVLYLAVSPDGQTIVTGAGDETLRFWNIFPAKSTRFSSRASCFDVSLR